MAITVAGRKMTVTDATRQYAEEKIGNAMKVMDIDPLDAEVVLSVKKNPSIALPCVCEVTIRTKGNVVRVEEEEQDIFSAIDVAAAKVLRQLRKYKTRVIDRKVRAGAHGDPGSIRTMEGDELDLDALMADLSADEEIVRVKEIEFAPMTEEEALIQIDLLGRNAVFQQRDPLPLLILLLCGNTHIPVYHAVSPSFACPAWMIFCEFVQRSLRL